MRLALALGALCVALAGGLWLSLDRLEVTRAELKAARLEAAQARAAANVAAATASREADRANTAAAIRDELAAIMEDADVPLPPDLADLVNGAADRLR